MSFIIEAIERQLSPISFWKQIYRNSTNLIIALSISQTQVKNSIGMESLTVLRMHLAISGIRSKQSSPQQYPFNGRSSLILFVMGFGIISYAKQLHESATFEEHAYVAYHMITSCFCFTTFLSISCKTPELMKLLDDLDELVRNSKLNREKRT